MPQINFISTNFTSGELSPQIEGRVDIAKYQNSAATLNNVFVKVFGGAYRRPGTYYAEVTKLSIHPVRIIPFQHSTEQAYIVEIGDKYFRFYKDSGALTSGTPIEVTTPYTSSNVFALQYAQDADTMYMTHTGHPCMKLTRSSHYLWSLAQVDFKGGPWMPANSDEGAYIKSSGSSGNVTITASGNATFVAGHSGSLLRIGTSNGYVKITTVSSSTIALATVQNTTVNATALSFTDDWAMGAWNVANGFPQAVSFFEQRLYFASTGAEPQTIWGSVPLDYENFTPGSDDADAVIFTIADNQVNAIRWLAAGKELVEGTLGGNFIMRSDTSSGPITPTNINIKKETTAGSQLILPNRIGSAIVYVQRDGKIMRELAYNFEDDAYRAEDLTILSDHITKSGVVDMDFQEVPDSILWCLRSDGAIATMTRLASQEVSAWSKQETLGTFDSVAIIPNGAEDQVWVVVQRSVHAGVVRFIEYFKPFTLPDLQRDCFFVDCGLSRPYSATAASVLTGLDHLNSRNVSVLGDGAVYPNVMVTGGSITISKSCHVIHVGLPYTSTIKTVRLEAGSVANTTQGLIKRVVKSIVRLWRSLGCQVGNETTQDTVLFRDTTMPMDEAPTLFTGDKPIQFPVGWNKLAQVYITQSQPLPLNVLAVISKVEVSTE